MTLEASLIVPIFLNRSLMLTSAGEILMIHQQISHGACEAAKRAAVNEYRIRQKKNLEVTYQDLVPRQLFWQR